VIAFRDHSPVTPETAYQGVDAVLILAYQHLSETYGDCVSVFSVAFSIQMLHLFGSNRKKSQTRFTNVFHSLF
jgi:hypothetical protein